MFAFKGVFKPYPFPVWRLNSWSISLFLSKSVMNLNGTNTRSQDSNLVCSDVVSSNKRSIQSGQSVVEGVSQSQYLITVPKLGDLKITYYTVVVFFYPSETYF